jgi:YHS domain-containing protein
MLTVLAAGLSASAMTAPPERTLTKDPVELVAGREVEGLPELSIVHQGVGYRFATAESKARFEKDPAAFEVADGGACGRMGPLSGLGDARRFAVHQGRIYFFASDGCRAGFLKDPAAHIETADEMPFGSNEQVLEGRAAMDKLVAWAGGVERIRAFRTFRAWAERTEKQGDQDWRVTNETIIEFPRNYFQKEAWNEHWFSTASGPEGGTMASAKGAERIADARTRAFDRAMARWPIVIIHAHADGAPRADCPGLVVISDGEGVEDNTAVQYVKVWLNGATSRLTIEKSSGKLLGLSFHGRDGSMRVGDVHRTFTSFKTEGGLTLPTSYSVTLDGKSLPRAALTLDGFRTDEPVRAELFQTPAWAD